MCHLANPPGPTLSQRRQDAHRWLALTLVTVVAAVFLLRALPPETTSFYPACPFHAWTGLLCPGCGGTRAFAALAHGRFVEAVRLNLLVVGALPLCAVWLAVAYLRATLLLRKHVWPSIPPLAVIGALALAAAFTVARNLR